MLDTWTEWLFDPIGLTPHGYCLLWEPGLLWLHAGSDTAVGLSYFIISLALIAFIRKRKDLVFRPVFGLFAAFILLCGMGHWMDLLTLWVPAYRFAGLVKLATAIVSALTAVSLWKLMPQALMLPSPAQLRQAHDALAALEARASVLRRSNAELERSAQILDEAWTAAKELARLRHYDPLTGLANRRLIEDRLLEIQRSGEADLALVFLDLDRFKTVNDTMGHQAGDALLIAVAKRLVAMAGPNDLAARLGGDEFVLLCRGYDAAAVSALGGEIRRRIAEPLQIAGRACHVSASVGIATAPSLGSLDLLRAADMAMYVAKQNGGNREVIFEPALFDKATQQFELEHDMRTAILEGAGNQFVLLYQPIFSIVRGQQRLVGLEALVRWRHPLHGWLSPSLFVPMAERSGLILPLGDWIMATALRQGQLFRSAYPAAELTMTVNVSPAQLSSAGFTSQVVGALEADGFPPSALCIEVTESILTEAEAAAALVDIRRIGVRVAIDDFGIGYSSLSYLRRLPADIVKLDRSFLADMKIDTAGDGFVSAVIALAHAAGKPVVFEGIETQDQFDVVSAAGADMVQGFFLAPPLSAHAAEDLVIQHYQFKQRVL